MIRTVTVGPFPIQFGNVNKPMGLAAHRHTAAVTLVYATLARHGYPSFRETNDAIREYLRELTGRMFRDATNEDVVDRLFEALDGWTAPEWERWGGEYQLAAVHLDVQGVLDDIGHDEGTTRYTTARPDVDVALATVAPELAAGNVVESREGHTGLVAGASEVPPPAGAGASIPVVINLDVGGQTAAVAGRVRRAMEEEIAVTRRLGWGQ
jgi:hypothetical protein